jgi:hypothetical protein
MLFDAFNSPKPIMLAPSFPGVAGCNFPTGRSFVAIQGQLRLVVKDVLGG